MNINNLIQACESFEKMAQKIKPKPDPARQKEVKLWSDTLFAGVRGTANALYSPAAARKIFDSIAQYHKSSAMTDQATFRLVEQLLTAISFSEEKLVGLGLDPIQILNQKGMQNLHKDSLNILKSNLEILRDAQDFSGYRHYYLVSPGAPKDVIELDTPQPKPGDSGY